MRRYQNGTLELTDTSAGPCWYIRFTDADGKRPRHRIGLKADLPTRLKAHAAAQPLRERFNAGELRADPVYTMQQVIDRYEREEMPRRHDTARAYRQMHTLYIAPRWGKSPLASIEPLEVRAWLRELTLQNGQPASSRTRGHIHGQMKNLFKYAMLWRWMPPQVNPLSLFSLEGATKRTRKPRVVSPAQFRAILAYFAAEARMQTMLLLAYCLGLRSSELIGLRWGDVDHLNRTVHILRSVVRSRVDAVKTERSEAPLPLAPVVAEVLLRWREVTPFREPEDWVFASKLRAGRIPVDANKLQTRWLKRAADAVGLDFPLGWHTFRHSYKSLLDRVSEDATLKRDLMRHSDVHTTMQVYGEVEMDRLRHANDAAVDLALPEPINWRWADKGHEAPKLLTRSN